MKIDPSIVEKANAKLSLQHHPYIFSPTKTLTTKELTEVLKCLFEMKPVSQKFYDDLPDTIKPHFKSRTPIEETK